jgi:hypothetical protein
MSSRTDFARLQFDWLKQVQDDPAVDGAAFSLAFAICRHLNAKSLSAWPTQETLAGYVHTDVRRIRRLTQKLVDYGHLTVSVSRGRHKPNVYRMATQNRTPMPAFTDRKPDTHTRFSENKTGHLKQENRAFEARKPGPSVLQNTLKEHLEEHSSDQRRDAYASKGGLDEDSKRILFDDGLRWLAEKTNRSSASLRTAVGQMLKAARDDAGHVLAVLRRARREDVAEPVSWILGVLRNRQGPAPEPNSAPSSVPAGLVLSKRAARA